MASRAWLHPLAAERAYQVMLLAYIADMGSETLDSLKQWGVLDATGATWLVDLAAVLAALRAWHEYQAEKVIKRLPDVYGAVARFNDKEWQAVVKAGTGLAIGPSGGVLPTTVQAAALGRSFEQTRAGGGNTATTAPSRPSNINGASNASNRLDPASGRAPGPAPLAPLPLSTAAISPPASISQRFDRPKPAGAPPILPPGGSSSGINGEPPGRISTRLGFRVDVYRSEPWLAARQEEWVAQNSALIKTVPSEYMGRVETIIRQGVMNGLSSKELAAQIKEASGVSERRAKVIAVDQIGKANSKLTEYRQLDLGIKSYTWNTSHDERVRGTPGGRYPNARPSHFARDKKVFQWAKPPVGGHAGIAILCRCNALPVFDDDEDIGEAGSTEPEEE